VKDAGARRGGGIATAGEQRQAEGVPNLLLSREPAAVEYAATQPSPARSLPLVELPQVASVYRESYAGTSHAFSQDEADDELRATAAGDFGAYSPELSAVVESGGLVVGAVLVVRDPPYPDVPPGLFILDLFVVPDARRRGYGRALVRHALNTGSERIALRVDADNVPALSLYRSLGFAQPYKAQ
jgi:ribosomal protein S18 acetylase RimI-like enzyme